MAPRRKTPNERGSALVEATAALLVLFVFASGVLVAAYFLFARAWLQYQSEQALLCLGEGRSWQCEREFRQKMDLPWGRLEHVHLRGERDWAVEAEWACLDVRLSVRKKLSVAAITTKRDLP